jgi:P2 family phage contractile tail tube protein
MTQTSFPLLTMEAANIFCGVEAPSDPTQSNHLRLTDIKLPGMDEQYVDHRGAGAPVAIEIDTVFARLECTFTLAGWSTDVAALIGQWGSAANQFWVFGALRDRVTGNVLQGQAKIYGRLGRADPQQWRRGDVSHWAYALRGITRYNLSVGAESVYEFDYYNNIFNIAGNPVTFAVNQALNLV